MLSVRLALAAAALACAASPAAAAERAPVLAHSYGGLGSWIDVFDGPAWDNPEAAVRRMSRNGATILFLQTASSRPGPTVFRPDRTERFLRAAHAREMTVVAWYLPPWSRPRYETRRAVGAIRFERNGERFDSFALDIETAEGSPPASVRNRRLLALSRSLRKAAGPLYPLGAITPSPAGLDMPHGRRWWPDFPFRALNEIYDAFVPMGYYTYHATTARGAYVDTRRNIRILRRETGDPAVPIHLIGGGAGESNAAEGRAFARAANRYGVIGASMYDQMTMGPEDWRAVRAIRFRPVPGI
ncbi:MAG: hypothetical protein QOJ22_267 [Thermoleophilaceae bacterium]|jgi:hypothetical protein|nr:hypothetical protein [Thermoleophilaceae bacterium]